MNGPQVWKYALGPGETRIEVPLGGQVVHVGVDPQGVPSVWILVQPETMTGQRIFIVAGTGQPVPPRTQHHGSWVDGQFVWHLFEVVA